MSLATDHRDRGRGRAHILVVGSVECSQPRLNGRGYQARLLFRVALLGWASALAGCFTVQLPEDYYRPRRTIFAAERVELPATFVGDYPFVEVLINGTGPFRLMLDSGCSNLMLSPHAAKLAHVRANPFLTEHVSVNGGKGAVRHYTAQVNRVEVGGLQLEGVKALVPDQQAWATKVASVQKVEKALEFGDFDGFLGMAALFDLILEIDYPNRQVAVVRPAAGRFPPERAVPYELNHGVGFVTLDLGGKTARALVDTGSNGGFDLPTIDDVPLLNPKQKVDGVGAFGAGGQMARETWGQMEGEIRLGPITWQNALVFTSDRKDAVIGSRALKPWKVVFDQPARRLYFIGERPLATMTKIPVPDARFKPGYFCELHGDGVRLLEVDSGGTFEQAGLRVGDVISFVDGFSAVDWVSKSRRVPSEVYQKPRLKLNVEREGKRFEAILVQGPDGS